MNANNEKWFTVILITEDHEYKVIMHIKSQGLTELTLCLLRPTYSEKLRTLEGKIDVVNDKIKAKYFYCL